MVLIASAFHVLNAKKYGVSQSLCCLVILVLIDDSGIMLVNMAPNKSTYT